MPVDAGPVVMSHLSGLEVSKLAELNRGTHQASMRGQLIALVRQGNFRGITALCQRWADIEIDFKPVLDKVLDEVRQQPDEQAAAETTREVLRAIVEVKRNGVPR